MKTLGSWGTVILIGLILGLLNLAKPLVIDDGIFIQVAWNILQNPFDPVGFETVFRGFREPAAWFPAPPIVPYWLAVSMTLGGDSEIWLKLAFIPWTLLFAASVSLLARRFLRTAQTPFLWTFCLSPAILPAANLMTDIPSLALTMAGIALWLHALYQGWDGLQRRQAPDLKFAALGGLILGLASLAKLTAVSALAAITAFSLLLGPTAILPGAIAVAIAAAMPVAWECFYYFAHGISPTLFQVRHPPISKNWPVVMAGNFSHLCVCALCFVLLLLWSITRRPVAVLALLAVWTAFTAVLAFKELSYVYTVCAAVLGLVVLFAAAVIHCRRERADAAGQPFRLHPGVVTLLFSWLAIELLCAWVISPFTAVRRVLLACAILGLIAWRAWEDQSLRLPLTRMDRIAVGAVAISGIVFGLLFYRIDYAYGSAVRDAIAHAATLTSVNIPPHQSQPVPQRPHTVFVGSWSGTYYSRVAGFEEALPNETVLQPGQYLVIAEDGLFIPDYQLPSQCVKLIERFHRGIHPGYSPLYGFYAGSYALHHQETPLVQFAVYQVTEPFVFETRTSPEAILKRTFVDHQPVPPGYVRPFMSAVLNGNPDALPNAVQILADSTELSLEPCLTHPAAPVRAAVLDYLAQNPARITKPGRFLPALEFLAQNDTDPANRAKAAQVLQVLAK